MTIWPYQSLSREIWMYVMPVCQNCPFCYPRPVLCRRDSKLDLTWWTKSVINVAKSIPNKYFSLYSMCIIMNYKQSQSAPTLTSWHQLYASVTKLCKIQKIIATHKRSDIRVITPKGHVPCHVMQSKVITSP